MPIRAVLFDLDGTLLDSLTDIGESMNFVLKERGLEPHPLSSYLGFVGDGMEMLARRALPPDQRSEQLVSACVARMREVYAPRADRQTVPYDGVPELLDELARAGRHLAVLSNKPHAITVALVGRLLGRWGFAAVFGERPGVPRKPDPAGALEVARDLGLRPAEVLYVGDTPTDVRTALAAGMPLVAAGWGFRSESELREAGAGRVARRPGDVLDCL